MHVGVLLRVGVPVLCLCCVVTNAYYDSEGVREGGVVCCGHSSIGGPLSGEGSGHPCPSTSTGECTNVDVAIRAQVTPRSGVTIKGFTTCLMSSNLSQDEDEMLTESDVDTVVSGLPVRQGFWHSCPETSTSTDLSAPETITVSLDACEGSGTVDERSSTPWVNVEVQHLVTLLFPTNVSVGECNIGLEGAIKFHYTVTFKISTSPGTPCHFGHITSPDDEFEPIDLCSANDEARLYQYDQLQFADEGIHGSTRESFSIVITPTWMCAANYSNVSCCDDEYAKHVPEEDIASPEYAKNFKILCDGQYCIDEAYICDGIASCADGADEGAQCDVVGSGGRVGCVGWMLAATTALLATP